MDIPVYRLHSQTRDKETEPKVDQGEEIEETEVDIETIENSVEKEEEIGETGVVGSVDRLIIH